MKERKKERVLLNEWKEQAVTSKPAVPVQSRLGLRQNAKEELNTKTERKLGRAGSSNSRVDLLAQYEAAWRVGVYNALPRNADKRIYASLLSRDPHRSYSDNRLMPLGINYETPLVSCGYFYPGNTYAKYFSSGWGRGSNQ